jgi:hypothetical protein
MLLVQSAGIPVQLKALVSASISLVVAACRFGSGLAVVNVALLSMSLDLDHVQGGVGGPRLRVLAQGVPQVKVVPQGVGQKPRQNYLGTGPRPQRVRAHFARPLDLEGLEPGVKNPCELRSLSRLDRSDNPGLLLPRVAFAPPQPVPGQAQGAGERRELARPVGINHLPLGAPTPRGEPPFFTSVQGDTTPKHR